MESSTTLSQEQIDQSEHAENNVDSVIDFHTRPDSEIEQQALSFPCSEYVKPRDGFSAWGDGTFEIGYPLETQSLSIHTPQGGAKRKVVIFWLHGASLLVLQGS